MKFKLKFGGRTTLTSLITSILKLFKTMKSSLRYDSYKFVLQMLSHTGLEGKFELSGFILRVFKRTPRILCWGYQWDHMFEVSSQMDKFGGVLIFLFVSLARVALWCDCSSINKCFNLWRTKFFCPAPLYYDWILYKKAMFQVWRSSTKVWKIRYPPIFQLN